MLVGRAMFETDGVPPGWVEKMNQMDEVWVPSQWNVGTFTNAGVTAKLVVIPEAVDTEHRFNPVRVLNVQKFALPLPPLLKPKIPIDQQLLQTEWPSSKNGEVHKSPDFQHLTPVTSGRLRRPAIKVTAKVGTEAAAAPAALAPSPGNVESYRPGGAAQERAGAGAAADVPAGAMPAAKPAAVPGVTSLLQKTGNLFVNQLTDVIPVVPGSATSLAADNHGGVHEKQDHEHDKHDGEVSKDPYFKFLSVFKWHKRKGVDVLIRAYCQEFTSDDRVALFIKTNVYNGSPHAELKHILVQLAHELNIPNQKLPRIKILDDWVPEHALPGLYAAADAFVLPSRGEGWGLPAAEAMAMGLPTIVTDWSGTTAFATEDVALPVKYSLRELTPDDMQDMYVGAQLDGHRYAEPNLQHLRDRMRWVVENRVEAKELGSRAREHMRTHFSPEAVGKIVADHIALIAPNITVGGKVAVAVAAAEVTAKAASEAISKSAAVEMALSLTQKGSAEAPPHIVTDSKSMPTPQIAISPKADSSAIAQKMLSVEKAVEHGTTDVAKPEVGVENGGVAVAAATQLVPQTTRPLDTLDTGSDPAHDTLKFAKAVSELGAEAKKPPKSDQPAFGVDTPPNALM